MVAPLDLEAVGSPATQIPPDGMQCHQQFPITSFLPSESEEISEELIQTQILAESLNHVALTIPTKAVCSQYQLIFWEKKEMLSTILTSELPIRAVKFVNCASNTGASATDYEVTVWTVKKSTSFERSTGLVAEVLIKLSLTPALKSPISNLSFFLDANIQAPNIFLLCRFDALIASTAAHIQLYDNKTVFLGMSDTTTIRSFGSANGVNANSNTKKGSDRNGAPYGAACDISENGIFAFQVDTYDIVATTGANSATPKWACCQNEPVMNLLFLPSEVYQGTGANHYSSGSLGGNCPVSEVLQLATLLAASQRAVTEWKISGVSDPQPVRQLVFGDSALVSVMSSGTTLGVFNAKGQVALVNHLDSSEPNGISVSLYNLPIQVPSLPRMSFSYSKRQRFCIIHVADNTGSRPWGWSTASDSGDTKQPVGSVESAGGIRVLPPALSSDSSFLSSDARNSILLGSGAATNLGVLSTTGTGTAGSPSVNAPLTGMMKNVRGQWDGKEDLIVASGLRESQRQSTEGSHSVPNPTTASGVTGGTNSSGGLISQPSSGMEKRPSASNDHKAVLPTFCGSKQPNVVGGGQGSTILSQVAEQGRTELKKAISSIENQVQRINDAKLTTAKALEGGSVRLISLSLEAQMTILEEYVKSQLPSGKSMNAASQGNSCPVNNDRTGDTVVKSFRRENEILHRQAIRAELEKSCQNIVDGVDAAAVSVLEKDLIVNVMLELKDSLRETQRNFIQRRLDELIEEPSKLIVRRMRNSFSQLCVYIRGEQQRCYAALASLKEENKQLRQCIDRLTAPSSLKALEELRAEVVELRETVAAMQANRQNGTSETAKKGNSPSVLEMVVYLIRVQRNLTAGLQHLIAAENPFLAVALLQELTPAENDSLIETPEEVVPVEDWAGFVILLSKACCTLIQDPHAGKGMIILEDDDEKKLVLTLFGTILDVMTAQSALLGSSGVSSTERNAPHTKGALRKMRDVLQELQLTVMNNYGNDSSFESVMRDLKVSLR